MQNNRRRRKPKPRLEDYEPGSIEYLRLENELLKREIELQKRAIPLIEEIIRNRPRKKSDSDSSED